MFLFGKCIMYVYIHAVMDVYVCVFEGDEF